jgi:predicted 3-demethylubiquinone-9 3-methyltransferase (glyoxalase superfamily)
MKKTIYPCLWFDGKAKEAAGFYNSVFQSVKITDENPLVVNFEIDGQKFMALNGGPQYTFNPSISFFAMYETEEEVMTIWSHLLDGGTVLMPLDSYPWSAKYGWVQDRFGLSWQVYLGQKADVGSKFAPSLMFTGKQNGKAEQAIKFYTSLFDDSRVDGILKYGPEDGETEENVKHAQFRLGNQSFMAMDSSYEHGFGFNEAVSFVVSCDTQEEIDFYWDKLSEGGEESQCGWLKDQFGVSWQIVPAILGELMSDPSRSERVIQTFLQMKKFDIEKLVNA